MDHRLKTFVFKMLQALPTKIGDDFYHALQDFKGRIPVGEEVQSQKETFDTMFLILDEIQFQAKNKTVLELGSGWLPVLPYFLKYYAKCGKILTYDTREHYNPKKIEKLNDYFLSKLVSLEHPVKFEGKFNLPSDIHYHPRTNILVSPPPPESVDFAYSRFVMEHVSPDELYRIHLDSKKWLKKGGIWLHFVSPSDHRAYQDKSLSLQDFLQYSQHKWNEIQTHFDYHNRLRLPQYCGIFQKTGLSIICQNYSKPSMEDLRKFQKIKIHEDFKHFTSEELTAASLIFVLQNK